jgi:hypothetical protein
MKETEAPKKTKQLQELPATVYVFFIYRVICFSETETRGLII